QRRPSRTRHQCRRIGPNCRGLPGSALTMLAPKGTDIQLQQRCRVGGLRTEAEMRYYAEGDYSLIRLHAPVDDSSVDAVLPSHGQLYRGGEGWIDPPAGRDLVIEALFSGNYHQVDEAEANRVQGVLDAERAGRGGYKEPIVAVPILPFGV